MRDATYLREQAKLSLEVARQLSDRAAAARVRLNAATFLAEAEEIEQQANPDQDFCAGYEKIEPELENWRDKPPLSLDDLVT